MPRSRNQGKYLNLIYLPLFMSIKGLFSRVCFTFVSVFVNFSSVQCTRSTLFLLQQYFTEIWGGSYDHHPPVKGNIKCALPKPWAHCYSSNATRCSSSERPLKRHIEKFSLCSKDLANWHNPQSCFISEDECFKSWWSGKNMLFSSCTKWTQANVKPNEFLKNGTAGITKAEN